MDTTASKAGWLAKVESEARQLVASLLVETNAELKRLTDLDQTERAEYSRFVKTQAGGDWDKGARLYAARKGRAEDDIFGERAKLQKFVATKFDFAAFGEDDWSRYWLLAQHCDFDRNFQKEALRVLAQFQPSSDNFKFLADRTSCAMSGTQKYGTQAICAKDGA